MSERPNAAVKAEAALKDKAVDPNEGIFERDHKARGVSVVDDAEAGAIRLLMPDGVTPRTKIALVGFASSTKDLAPYSDPEWAVVGMNQLNRHIPRADAWFEIHKDYLDAVVPGTDHEAWLSGCCLPVFMTARRPQLPTSVCYPVDRLIEKFGIDYFTSTVAYMLAWAIDYIDQEVQVRLRSAPANGLLQSAWDVTGLVQSVYRQFTIGIFGIDLVVGEEYTEQRPCAEFWLGQALARDISVMIPPQSALLKQRYRYGYQMEREDLVRDSDIAKRLDYLSSEHQKHAESLMQLVGAVKELEGMRELRRLRERGASVG